MMISRSLKRICLLTGTTNPGVAKSVARRLGIRLTPATVKRFSVGEIHTRVDESVRGKEAFVLATANTGRINDDFMETKIFLQTLALASVKDISLFMFAMPYLRQDRKDEPRVPITAVLALQELYNAARGKMKSLIIFDPHSIGTEGFMAAAGIPSPAALTTRSLFVDYIEKNFPLDRLMLIAPDIGRTKWVASVARTIYGPEEYFFHYLPTEKIRAKIDAQTFVYNRELDMQVRVGRGKKRIHATVTPGGREVIILDDMIDRGGTMRSVARELVGQTNKPNSISTATPHGYFSGNSLQVFEKDHNIDQMIVTNTLNIGTSPKLKVLDISPLVTEIIFRIATTRSLQGYNLSI